LGQPAGLISCSCSALM